MTSERAGATMRTLEEFWSRIGLPPSELPRQRFNRRRYLPLLDFVDPTPDATILDVGAGIGNLCVAMHAPYGGVFDYADFALPSPAHQESLRSHGVERFFAVNLADADPFRAMPGGYEWILFTGVMERVSA